MRSFLEKDKAGYPMNAIDRPLVHILPPTAAPMMQSGKAIVTSSRPERRLGGTPVTGYSLQRRWLEVERRLTAMIVF
uniref:Uncharacterized protein n=1 Tax=Trichuris muris TaxID=70415 RepID=A0A5S6QWU5_TRIMR